MILFYTMYISFWRTSRNSKKKTKKDSAGRKITLHVPYFSQEKRSVISTASDKSKNEKESELGRLLEEEKKKNAELQKELDLQVKS